MKKKAIYIIASAALLVFVGATGFIYAQKNNEPEAQIVSASWVFNYADIKEISQDSDIIALVKVEGVSKSSEKSSIPLTEFAVEVVTALHGTDLGEKLNIVMTGGYDNKDVVSEIKDDPLLKENEEFLIFARKNDDGTITILGGPQGRLVHHKGKLNSITPANTNAQIANKYSNIQIVDANLEDIIKEINVSLKEKQSAL